MKKNTFIELLFLSIRKYFSTFYNTFMLIIFTVVVKDTYIYLDSIQKNQNIIKIIKIFMGLFIFYLLCAILRACYSSISNKETNFRIALYDLLPKLWKLITSLIIFLFFPVILYFILKLTSKSFFYPLNGNISFLFVDLFFSFLLMFFYLRFFFVIPLIVMESISVRNAFKDSSKLFKEKKNWMQIFFLYAVTMFIFILLSPKTLNIHLIKIYKVSAIFDFIVYSITLPIWANFVVLLGDHIRLR